MNYRSLLVHLDDQPSCAQRTQFAIRLARQLDCHLVGVAPTGLVTLPTLPDPSGSFGQLGTLAWDALCEQAERAAAAFGEACKAAGLRSFEAFADEEDGAASLVHHAYCSDLVLLGQVDPEAPGHVAAQAVVEQVVLHSARPTLILPYVGCPEAIGQRVMVAWNDSREAARALADALPLLREASLVQVVRWQAADDAAAARRTHELAPLCQWLLWHGVTAEARAESTVNPVADAMLSRAGDLDIDLIVMGAYGHPRWSERVLGGATRGLLRSMTVPVLMSH